MHTLCQIDSWFICTVVAGMQLSRGIYAYLYTMPSSVSHRLKDFIGGKRSELAPFHSESVAAAAQKIEVRHKSLRR